MAERLKFLFLFLSVSISLWSQGLPTDGPLTLRPMLQQLGERLLQGKTGSIVAVNPANGEILCIATNTPNGHDVRQAIGKPQAPGSTIKPAQALTLLSEGIVTTETTVDCNKGFIDGNIRVGCHQHRSPLKLKDAIAQSCNSWFLVTFAQMINDNFVYEDKNEAITTWRSYMQSMGLGGPMHIDIQGEQGGLLAGADYLNRRYKNGWDGKTIWWAGMGQGDITLTPLQLCNLAVTIANRGWYYIPHIHKDTKNKRYLTKRHTKVDASVYAPVVEGMRLAVEKGTATCLRTTYPVCGKTGTVENPGADHSAFIGFAPMNEPKIAISVYIEHGGFGADMAAPIAGLIIEQYLKGKLSPQSEAKAARLAKTKSSK
ncbi:MAG: penicillin-binding protein [Paludibacteraceae bacterium]|nr:penicillin-binding protein [Paludibacteraceae bacterium]MBQ8715628.1 penicillin-binding protein [Prevotella sp.]